MTGQVVDLAQRRSQSKPAPSLPPVILYMGVSVLMQDAVERHGVERIESVISIGTFKSAADAEDWKQRFLSHAARNHVTIGDSWTSASTLQFKRKIDYDPRSPHGTPEQVAKLLHHLVPDKECATIAGWLALASPPPAETKRARF